MKNHAKIPSASGTESSLKYQQIAADLREKIVQGVYTSGDKLPGVRDIARQFQSSVVTANRALSELEETGHVIRHRRRGTFVEEKALKLRSFLVPVSNKWSEDDPQLMLHLVGILREAGRRQVQARLELYDSPIFESAAAIRDTGCQGIIQMGMGDRDFPAQAIRASGLIQVAVGAQDEYSTHSVSLDRKGGTQRMVELMRKKGCKRIGLIANLFYPNHRSCRDGYLAGTADLDIGASLVRDANPESLDIALKELIERQNCDGLIVSGAMCIRAAGLLWQMGRRLEFGCLAEVSAVEFLGDVAHVVLLNHPKVGESAVEVLAAAVEGISQPQSLQVSVEITSPRQTRK